MRFRNLLARASMIVALGGGGAAIAAPSAMAVDDYNAGVTVCAWETSFANSAVWPGLNTRQSWCTWQNIVRYNANTVDVTGAGYASVPGQGFMAYRMRYRVVGANPGTIATYLGGGLSPA